MVESTFIEQVGIEEVLRSNYDLIVFHLLITGLFILSYFGFKKLKLKTAIMIILFTLYIGLIFFLAYVIAQLPFDGGSFFAAGMLSMIFPIIELGVIGLIMVVKLFVITVTPYR